MYVAVAYTMCHRQGDDENWKGDDFGGKKCNAEDGKWVDQAMIYALRAYFTAGFETCRPRRQNFVDQFIDFQTFL